MQNFQTFLPACFVPFYPTSSARCPCACRITKAGNVVSCITKAGNVASCLVTISSDFRSLAWQPLSRHQICCKSSQSDNKYGGLVSTELFVVRLVPLRKPKFQPGHGGSSCRREASAPALLLSLLQRAVCERFGGEWGGS